jgi:hypothetical protein
MLGPLAVLARPARPATARASLVPLAGTLGSSTLALIARAFPAGTAGAGCGGWPPILPTRTATGGVLTGAVMAGGVLSGGMLALARAARTLPMGAIPAVSLLPTTPRPLPATTGLPRRRCPGLALVP